MVIMRNQILRVDRNILSWLKSTEIIHVDGLAQRYSVLSPVSTTRFDGPS